MGRCCCGRLWVDLGVGAAAMLTGAMLTGAMLVRKMAILALAYARRALGRPVCCRMMMTLARLLAVPLTALFPRGGGGRSSIDARRSLPLDNPVLRFCRRWRRWRRWERTVAAVMMRAVLARRRRTEVLIMVNGLVAVASLAMLLAMLARRRVAVRIVVVVVVVVSLTMLLTVLARRRCMAVLLVLVMAATVMVQLAVFARRRVVAVFRSGVVPPWAGVALGHSGGLSISLAAISSLADVGAVAHIVPSLMTTIAVQLLQLVHVVVLHRGSCKRRPGHAPSREGGVQAMQVSVDGGRRQLGRRTVKPSPQK